MELRKSLRCIPVPLTLLDLAGIVSVRSGIGVW